MKTNLNMFQRISGGVWTVPDDKCSLCCSSWMPKTSALHWALDYSPPLTCPMNPPLKFSGSDLSSWWPGSPQHGLLPCHNLHACRKEKIKVESFAQNTHYQRSRCMCVFLTYSKELCDFSIQSAAIGIGRTVFPTICPCTTDVWLHRISTCRRMSSDIRFGHVWWFLLLDSSGTHILGRQKHNKVTQNP